MSNSFFENFTPDVGDGDGNDAPRSNGGGSGGGLFLLNNISSLRCIEENKKDNLFGAIMVALIVVGLVGNSLVFFTIMVLREYKKSVTNWYILQLTLADTLFLLMLPFTAHSEFRGKWEFSESLCKFKEAVIFINYYASIYFLVVMSFDRYLAVTKAFASNYWVSNLRSPTASYIISIVGWVLSALLCIQLYNYSKIDDCQICKYEFPDAKDSKTFIIPENETFDGLDFQGTASPEYTTTELNFEDIFNYLSSGDEEGTGFLFNFNFTDEDTNTGTDLEEPNTDFGDYTIDSEEELQRFFLLHYNVYLEDNDLQIFLNQFKNEQSKVEEHFCKLPNSKELHIWLYGNFAGAFVLPFILICFFYGMIMKTITAASSIGDNEKQRSYRRRVTLIVLALVSLFGISWLPWYVDKLAKINGINLTASQCIQLSDAVRAIAYLNSAFNPYFYSFLGFHFRDRLKRASGQVRLLSSLRSRATLISSVRRKRQSSSNSVGSIRAPMATPASTNGVTYGLRQDNARGSLTQKTERTLV